MTEQLTKLRPDRDLQCYFQKPSAVAALSGASANAFVVSGTWRQQFDWAVIEWNRDNVFEHPSLRYLPDGDFRGVTLSYNESREGCVPLDSDLFLTVDWPYLRVWANDGTGEQFYQVRLRDHATPVGGSYTAASATFTLRGTPSAGDYIGISWLSERQTYQLSGIDTVESAVQAVVDSVNAFSPILVADRQGSTIRLRYVGTDRTTAEGTVGANGNRLGAYSYVASSGLQWDASSQVFSGGSTPANWAVQLNFDALVDVQGRAVPVHSVRKIRWTYAADLQSGSFARTEFEVRVTNWQVSGTGLPYRVAGPGSQRWEDSGGIYSGTWTTGTGNFSGGSIHCATSPEARVTYSLQVSTPGDLYLGTRYVPNGASVQVAVDNTVVTTVNLTIPGEDVLARIYIGPISTGAHVVTVSHVGAEGSAFYFDFLEVAVPSTSLRDVDPKPKLTLATDWDTDHSLALAAERTAWIGQKLGFRGRANHYVGALWFYELAHTGDQYAKVTISFSGTVEPNKITNLRIGTAGTPASSDAVVAQLHHVGQTLATVATAFALQLNNGFTSVWAEASGNTVTIWSRAMGSDGNQIRISADTNSTSMMVNVTTGTLTGGTDGQWQTDLTAVPRLNRAARDWSQAYFQAMANAGIPVTAAFSMELQHGPSDLATGLVQRYPSGGPVVLNTPAVQTNFSPVSLAYWREVYAEMAALMTAGGQTPYLQFGEVQWWYFPYDGSGMPFYDDYTKAQFRAQFGRELPVITSQTADPSGLQTECAFLAGLIGAFTAQVRAYVRAQSPNCRFEVLYPTDVNDTALNTLVNYPLADWSSANLDCLKTENFTYTGSRNLNQTLRSVQLGASLGFSPAQRSHLVGLSDANVPWRAEVHQAENELLESIVLFALDQFCLVGYPPAMTAPRRRSAWSR